MGLCKVKVWAPNLFFSNDFYFSFMLGLMDFSDTAYIV